jgi:hypothetical protein
MEWMELGHFLCAAQVRLYLSQMGLWLPAFTKYENLHIWMIKRARCRIHNERNEKFIEHENGWILKI